MGGLPILRTPNISVPYRTPRGRAMQAARVALGPALVAYLRQYLQAQQDDAALSQ